MIDGLKPYSDYKDSSVPWLGKVPKHWQVRRLKSIAKLNPSKSEASDSRRSCPDVVFLPMERVSADGRVDFRDTRPIRDVWTGFTYFRRDDVLVAKITPCFENGKGACLDKLPTPIGFGSTEFHVLRPLLSVTSKFLYFLTLLPDFRRLGADAMTGAAGQQRVPDTFVAGFVAAIPPLPEQSAIVSFLDHTDRLIRRYIIAKKKLIATLNEHKQALIENTVRRGLDPTVTFKQSGIEWLGNVPAHWIVARLRFRYHQCLGKMVDAKKVTGKWLVPYLRNVDVRWDDINTTDLPFIDLAPHERERFTVKAGDLLVCEGRHLGRCAFWKGDIEVCGFQKALHRLRPLNPNADYPRFLFYCMYLASVKDAFNMNKIDNTIPHLTGVMLRAHRFAFPPMTEQKAVSDYLDAALANIEKASATARAEIELLRELRTRLISDVVTGKLDVREAAPNLPDEWQEPVVEETDDFSESDAELESADLEEATAEI